MTERSCSSTRSAERRRIDDRAAAQEAIYRAIELLRAQHHVRETSAFTMLVKASADAHLNVRDTACRIVADACDVA